MTIQTPLQLVITIGIIALGTFLIRALPFFLFPAGKETPRVVAYLGAALPSASIAMLVVYCFKNVSVFSGSHGLPELFSAVFVIVVHKWRHNLLLSIVGTIQLFNEPQVMSISDPSISKSYTPMMMALNTSQGTLTPGGDGPASAVAIVMALIAGVLAVVYTLVERKVNAE